MRWTRWWCLLATLDELREEPTIVVELIVGIDEDSDDERDEEPDFESIFCRISRTKVNCVLSAGYFSATWWNEFIRSITSKYSFFSKWVCGQQSALLGIQLLIYCQSYIYREQESDGRTSLGEHIIEAGSLELKIGRALVFWRLSRHAQLITKALSETTRMRGFSIMVRYLMIDQRFGSVDTEFECAIEPVRRIILVVLISFLPIF